MLNSFSCIGRLQGDPKENDTNGKTVVEFWVVVDEDYDRTKYSLIPCEAWGSTGEFVKKYFRRGDYIGVTGRIRSYPFSVENGNNTLTQHKVRVNNAYFTGYKKKEESYDAPIEDIQDLPFL